MSVKRKKWLSIKQLCHLFPGRGGRPVARSTVMRWILHGVNGTKLESTKIGGLRYVSRKAVEEFLATLNHRPSTAKPIDRDRKAQRTEELLDAEGF